jgi:plastocyanin
MARSPFSRPSPTLVFCVLASLVFLMAACSSSGGASATQGATSTSSAASGSASASSGQVVKLSGLRFDPATLTVAVGAKVTFQNVDSADHTVTNGKDGTPQANPLFDQSLPQGAAFEFTFNTAGTVNVTCKIHKFMNMTITVQ